MDIGAPLSLRGIVKYFMPRFFLKASVVLLIAAIFQMTSGFCFEGLLSSVKIKAVQAASLDKNISATDVCKEGQAKPSTDNSITPEPLPSHHNSILPCCVDGSHSGVNFTSQFVDLGKLVLPNLSFVEPLPTIIRTQQIYHTPIIAPPDLLAVSTTILRL